MGCRCCRKTVRACYRRSYLEVDGYGASLTGIGGAGYFGANLKAYGALSWSHAWVPLVRNYIPNGAPTDWSGLYEGLFPARSGAPYYGSDWVWLQYQGPRSSGSPVAPGLFFSAADGLEWAVTRNDDPSGFTNKSWAFLGIQFSESFDRQSYNHFYVYQFQWTWGGSDHTAVVYIPEAPGRNWEVHGNGETGGYVIFNGVRYSMTDTYHANPPPGAYEHGGAPLVGNSMAFVVFLSQVTAGIKWAYPDAGTTTTTALGTTTTHDIDVWSIQLQWVASHLYDYLCHADKGAVDGFVPVVGSYRYRSKCDEVQDYSSAVLSHSAVYIKKLSCSDAAVEEGGDSNTYNPELRHTAYTYPMASLCVGHDVTTTTLGDCGVWSPPVSCNLGCIDWIAEPMWNTPVPCKYTVSAHDRTWELFRSWGSVPIYPDSGIGLSAKKSRYTVIAKGNQFRTDLAPHAELSVVNRVDGLQTRPWLVLKLGVVLKRWAGLFSFNYDSVWLGVYAYDLTSDKTIDILRHADVTLGRVWQYGEPADYCNELAIPDYRGQQNMQQWSRIVSGPIVLDHPYQEYASDYFGGLRTTPSAPIFDIGAWLLSSTTTSAGGDLYSPATYSGEFTLWGQQSDSPCGQPHEITSPDYITRPICSMIDDGLSPQELEESRPIPGDPAVVVPFTCHEYWIDMPASVVLEAI